MSTTPSSPRWKQTFKVSRSDTLSWLAPFDFVFEWDDGTTETRIPASLQAVTALGETFKSFGYEEEESSIRFKSI